MANGLTRGLPRRRLVSFGRSKSEIEGRSLAYRRLCPDAPRMALNYPLNGGQADPGSRELIGTMQPTECREEVVSIGHVEAGSIVLNVIDFLLVSQASPKFDLRSRLADRELPGILQHIPNSNPEQ